MIGRLLVVLLALAALGGPLLAPAGAQARTCETSQGTYEVTPPAAPPATGADPAELAAVDCALVYDEQQVYPLSLIAFCVVMTAVALVVIRRARHTRDPVGSPA
jgi:hypothetical protein